MMSQLQNESRRMISQAQKAEAIQKAKDVVVIPTPALRTKLRKMRVSEKQTAVDIKVWLLVFRIQRPKKGCKNERKIVCCVICCAFITRSFLER